MGATSVALHSFPWTDGGCFKGRRREYKELRLDLGTSAEQASWTERIEHALFPVGAARRPGYEIGQGERSTETPPPTADSSPVHVGSLRHSTPWRVLFARRAGLCTALVVLPVKLSQTLT